MSDPGPLGAQVPSLTPDDIRLSLPAALAERWRADADEQTQQELLIAFSALLGTLSTYLPRHLLNQVLLHATRGRIGGEFRFSTVLFVDISGFTTMSERLSYVGREGAETLTQVINDFFTTMSEIAAHYGGDVVIFAGDAMLLLFDGVDHALRACCTAWQMQQTMAERFSEVQTTLGRFPLRMAAGLGSGPIYTTTLGTLESMHYAVLGPAMVAMARAEALAGGGRIILDATTHTLAGAIAVEPEGEDGFVRLTAEPSFAHVHLQAPRAAPPPDEVPEQIAWLAQRIAAIVPFLPTGLLRRLLPDPSATLEGEHRPVTILFVDFRDADALVDLLGADEPHAITPRLNEAFCAVQSVIVRYEGVINKVSAGPVGPHIIALFGAPQSHEDDPERAVHAAIEIQAALKTSSLPGVHATRIGINTGFVYAANVGSRARREYTVMGDQVNLAARLMSVAQAGQIIVSASTAARIEDVFELEERAAVQVKGKVDTQRNFLVRRVARRSGQAGLQTSSELRGREQELSLAIQRLAEAAQGRAQIVALSGEAGAGKSRLIEALAQQAGEEGFEVVSNACVSYGSDSPYSVWIDALRLLIDIRLTDTEVARRRKLLVALAEIDRMEDVPILGEIIGVSLPDSEWVSTEDAQVRQRRLFDTVVALIKTRADAQPLLWVIDDAHWIDPASLELLNHVATHVLDARLILLAAYRRRNAWEGWAELPNAIELVLSNFDRATTERMIADLLGIADGQLPLALRTLLERMATGVLNVGTANAAAFEQYWGNPFFAQERVRALIDSGVLARDVSGRWQVTRSIESIEMPDTIHGLIMSRIDRLPETARRVLQVAAVIGRTFDLNVLQAVYQSPDAGDERLHQHLLELSDLGLLPVEGDDDGARYVFRNVTTQEVAYESLRYERRRELHRRIGQFIEAHPQRVDDAASLLTHHYYEGQVWEKALNYALEAGYSARQKYANATAAGAYRRALQAAESLSEPRPLEQLAAHEALADVLVVTGEYEEALRNYERARALADDARHLSDLCRKTAEAYERRSEYEEAFQWLEEGLKHAVADALEAARIYLAGAGVFFRQGRHDQAVEWCERCLNIARVLGDSTARAAEARALYLLAGIFHKRADLEQAIETAQRAVNVYLLNGDMWGQSQALNTLANAYSDQGDFASAISCYTDSLQLKERIGEVNGQAMIMLNLGDLYRSQGEYVQARQMFERSLRIFRDLRYTLAVALLWNNLSAVAIAEKQWQQAAEYLDESERLFQEVGSEDFKAELRRHRAEVSLGQDRLEDALHIAQQAASEAQAADEKLEMGLARRVLGAVYLAQNDLNAAERELLASLEMLESVGSQVEAANTRVMLATLREQQGRADEARALIDAAIQTYDAAGAEPLKAQTRV